MKSGTSDDNESLIIHVLPRMQGDGLEKINWQPKPASYDLDSVKGSISDKTWRVKYIEEEKVVIESPKMIENPDNEIDLAILELQKKT